MTFTKAKLIPSVPLLVDIPESATASFYWRNVNVCLKEATFQPSSQYLKTQISTICLFLKHDLDYIVAVQDTPYQSYRNWVERVMSIINLALQSAGLMRQPMVEKYRKMMNSINSQADIRECARKDLALKKHLPIASFLYARC